MFREVAYRARERFNSDGRPQFIIISINLIIPDNFDYLKMALIYTVKQNTGSHIRVIDVCDVIEKNVDKLITYRYIRISAAQGCHFRILKAKFDKSVFFKDAWFSFFNLAYFTICDMGLSILSYICYEIVFTHAYIL